MQPANPLLNDPQQPPAQTLLKSVLGDNYANFERLNRMLEARGLTSAWNYYRDGKSWLCKVLHGKRTVLWLSVWEGCFKLSFFFSEKTRSRVEELAIDPATKAAFSTQEASGKLIPLVLEIRDETLLDSAEKIIDYKCSSINNPYRI